ncbi:MAG: hypothetical protein ACFB11_16480, partial [Paracoccaceae bacterium]
MQEKPLNPFLIFSIGLTLTGLLLTNLLFARGPATKNEELLDALGAARGGETIVLSDGDYGSLDIENRSFSSHVTITSANPKGA